MGRLKAGPERDLSARYADRFAKAGPQIGLEFGRLLELPESRGGNPQTRRREEGEALEKALPESACLVLLDEHGSTVSSEHFAAMIGDLRDSGRRDVVLAIGGADGHGETLQARADVVLSFGRMTWPHQLVRIMASEQIYRAATILSGHPYHRS